MCATLQLASLSYVTPPRGLYIGCKGRGGGGYMRRVYAKREVCIYV